MHRRLVILLAALAVLTLLALPAVASAAPTFNQAVDKLFAQRYPQKVENYLNSLGTSPLGFRLAGTEADDMSAIYLANEFDAMGLSNVRLEGVPVDEWDVRGAWVRVNGRTMLASQFAGVPGTKEPIEGEIVYVGNGTRQEFDAAGDVTDKLVLIDTALDWWWLNLPGAEATARGAAGIIMTYGKNSYPWYAPATALGANDGEYDMSWLPIVYVSRRDGDWLKAEIEAATPPAGVSALRPAGLYGSMYSDVHIRMHDDFIQPGVGYNVVAEIPGTVPGAPATLIVSHHDAHFRAGLDDTGAVASQMVIAKAMKMSGYKPRGTVIFLSTTGEEFGYTNCWYDWCIGAWYSITETHAADWPGEVGAVVNLELMARKGGKLLMRTNPHLMGWLKSNARTAVKSGLLPYGYSTGPQSTWQDGWTFNAAGVPAFVFSAGGKGYDEIYHTTHENISIQSWPYLARITKFTGSLAKKLNTGLLPYSPLAQGYNLRAAADGDELQPSGVDATTAKAFWDALGDYIAAAKEYAAKKPGFTGAKIATVNRNLMAFEGAWAEAMTCLDIWDYEAYPYQQILWDAQSLDATIAELQKNPVDKAKALEMLEAVGLTWNGNYFSESVYEEDLQRHAPDYPLLTWAAQVDEAPHLNVQEQVGMIEAGEYADAITDLSSLRDANLALAADRLSEMTTALQNLTMRLQHIDQVP
jgi:hypothetical protein